jgi:hypothetical protein
MDLTNNTTGMLCSSETTAWYKVAVPAGETFYIEISDGFGQVYFELLDSSGKKHLTQEDESGRMEYKNNGNKTATYLLKVYIEESKKKIKNKSYKFQAFLR